MLLIMALNRREFVGGCTALAALPLVRRFPSVETDLRRAFDAVTGEPLAGIELVAKLIGAAGRWRFMTDADGYYSFGEIPAKLKEPGTVRIKVRTRAIKGRYIGFDCYMNIQPQPELNSGIGDLGFIPLRQDSYPFTFPETENQNGFRNRLVSLLKDIFFSVDNKPRPRPKATLPGALARFDRSDITVRVDETFTDSEFGFVEQGINQTLTGAAPGAFKQTGYIRIPMIEAMIPAAELPVGTITVIRRDDFPRPAVRIRYGRTNPSDRRNNPHEILSALIILDTFTLNELYRNGAGGSSQQQYARHIIHRCTAYTLGWRPTLRLPNNSVVDENYGPPGAYTRKLLTDADEALAAAITGGGSGCYAPGIRFSSKRKEYLVSDPRYPLNGK